MPDNPPVAARFASRGCLARKSALREAVSSNNFRVAATSASGMSVLLMTAICRLLTPISSNPAGNPTFRVIRAVDMNPHITSCSVVILEDERAS